MSEKKSNLRIQTVLGPVERDQLGITLPHEHLFIELGVLFNHPSAASLRHLAEEKIRLDHPDIGWLRMHPYSNKDNLRLLSETEAVEDLLRFKAQGGRTLVDVTLDSIGRDPQALCRVSRMTGVHVVMGCGYYIGELIPPEFDRKTEREIADEIVKDLKVGVGPDRVPAGIIGEIGCQWPLADREKKSLRASAMAQAETGAPLTIHPGRHEDAPMEIIKILTEAGADPERIIICHIDRTPFTLETRLKIADAGAVLEYDLFGWEGYYPLELAVAHMPNDVQRIKEIIEMRDRGHLSRVLASHDICYKTRRYAYGGHGYAHILQNAVPVMRAWGLSADEIHAIVCGNPGRLLAFA